MAAASSKTIAVLLAALLLALVASAVASRKLEEEDAFLGSLSPAPAPAEGGAAGLASGTPGAWAVAALGILLVAMADRLC
uniref:Uncharacterized protein n=1 Tax=Zea mays TaxID=4577 RepID=A0A804QZA6_MAIZE